VQPQVSDAKADAKEGAPLLKAVAADSSESLAKLAAIGGAAHQLVAVVQWLTEVKSCHSCTHEYH
jgi:hypothetical protein